MPGPQIDPRLSREGPDLPAPRPGRERGRLKDPCRGGPDRHNSLLPPSGLVDRLGGLLGKFGPLRVQDMVLDLLRFDRPKGTDPYMEGQVMAGNLPGRESRQDLLGEVKSR